MDRQDSRAGHAGDTSRVEAAPLRSAPIAAAILIVACAVSPPACASDPEGPIAPALEDPFPIRGQFPLYFPFLDPGPRSAFLLPARQAAWRFDVAYLSTHAASDGMIDGYRQDNFTTRAGLVTEPALEAIASSSDSHNAYYVDGETLRSVLEARMGVTDRLEIGLEIPILAHTGGFMDHAIETYHEQLGFPDGGRPPFAQNQYVIGYQDGDGTAFLGEAPGGAGLGDLVLSARAALLRDPAERKAFAASASLKLPTGDAASFDGSGKADFALGLLASWKIGRGSLNGGFHYAFLGGWSLVPAADIDALQTLFFSYTYRLRPRIGLLGQLLVTAGPFPDRHDGSLGDPSWEVAVGMRHFTHSGLTFDWAILENLSHALNVPDIGIYFGMGCRFPQPLPPREIPPARRGQLSHY